MKTLLVIAQQPALAAAIKAVIDGSRYRIMQQTDLREDELLLIPSSIDACILDAELTTIEPIRTIERLRKCLPHAPILIYAATTQWEWEEDAYLLGVNQVLTKPVRARLLNSLLDRLWEKKPAMESRAENREPRANPPMPVPAIDLRTSTLGSPMRMLEVLRNCSSILTHSLCAESLLKEFLLLLREIIGVNRAAIFLRAPPGSLGDVPNPEDMRRLHSACAIGLAPGLLEHFQLSLDAGIGGYVFKSGRILRSNSDEALRDPQMQKEFELLSAQVAIPVLDRESFIGLAVFDGRITGDAMTNEELALIFHLLEQLGMAVRNIWLHDQVTANHEMMANILRHLSSACVVIGRDLSILHANDMAKVYFPRPEPRAGAFEFRDLPQLLGSKVFEVFKTGQPVAASRFQAGDNSKTFQYTITPFKKPNATAPSAALLVVEDFTQIEKFQHLEIEAANLRLVKQMAERLAHEIGNAVVPISTHQQLLHEQIDDPDFQKSLEFAMDEGVKRVTRLVNQMRFLARDQVDLTEPVTVKELIEDAFREARLYQPSTSVWLQFETNGEQLSLFCDRVGLRHAFAEVILNALQANAQPCQVQVRATSQTDQGGKRWARIEVQDSGSGFTAESAGKASEPFYTTRNVGLGLGLAVTNKIIQTHRGKLEIPPTQTGQPSIVRISLPLEPIAHGSGENGH